MLATEVHRRLISDCNGRDPRSGVAPPGSGRLSRRGAAVRAVVCWRRLRRSLYRRRPPGFWVVLQKNGPEFDVIPEFWAVVSVPRRDSRRWLRYNPRSEAFTSSMSRSAAYETAQNFARAFQVTNQPLSQAAYETAQSFARALCRTLDRAKNGVMGLRNRPKLHSGVWPPSAG